MGKQAQGTSRLEWQESARKKVQGSAILNRLINHTLSETDIMSASQVNAARVLLNKTLPDLKAVEVTGNDGAPLLVRIDGKSADL